MLSAPCLLEADSAASAVSNSTRSAVLVCISNTPSLFLSCCQLSRTARALLLSLRLQLLHLLDFLLNAAQPVLRIIRLCLNLCSSEWAGSDTNEANKTSIKQFQTRAGCIPQKKQTGRKC